MQATQGMHLYRYNDNALSCVLYIFYMYIIHFRWGRLRASMMPWPGLLEPFTECLTLAILSSSSIYQLFGYNPLWPFCGHVLLWFFLDVCLIIQIQVTSLNDLGYGLRREVRVGL